MVDAYCRIYVSIIDNYKKLSVELISLPIISFDIITCARFLKIMMLSSSLSMNLSAFICRSFSSTSVISPSNTEFCIQFKYLRQSFSILPTLFSPKSYTNITYILPIHLKRFVFLNPQQVLGQFVTFQFNQMFVTNFATK